MLVAVAELVVEELLVEELVVGTGVEMTLTTCTLDELEVAVAVEV